MQLAIFTTIDDNKGSVDPWCTQMPRRVCGEDVQSHVGRGLLHPMGVGVRQEWAPRLTTVCTNYPLGLHHASVVNAAMMTQSFGRNPGRSQKGEIWGAGSGLAVVGTVGPVAKPPEEFFHTCGQPFECCPPHQSTAAVTVRVRSSDQQLEPVATALQHRKTEFGHRLVRVCVLLGRAIFMRPAAFLNRGRCRVNERGHPTCLERH